MTEFIVGDSRPYAVQLTINDAPFVIDPLTDTVKAALVASDKKVMLSSAAIVVSNTLPGSAWATSKVVVKFLRSQTAGIKKAQSALLEIQVTFNASDEDAADDWTWFIPVDLVLALIA